MKLYDIPTYAVKKAQKLGASDIVVSAGKSKGHQVKFVNNEIAVTKSNYDESAGVFLAYNKRVVSANIKTFTEQEVDRTLAKLIQLAKLLPPKEDFYGLAEGFSKYKKIKGMFDKNILDFDKSTDYVQAAINGALRSGAKRVAGVFDVSYDKSLVVSSKGLNLTEQSTGVSISLRALASKEASGHQVMQSNVLNGFNAEKVGIDAGTVAYRALNPKHTPAGKYDVLFYPLPVSDLLGGVAGAASIASLENGMSYLKKVGQIVGSSKLTMYDWANMPYGVDSYSCDAEGTSSQKTLLIKNGVFKSYLHNYSTSQKYKAKNTGNAGLVEPSPSNTYIVPGRVSVDSMIKQMKKGLVVTNNWYTTFQNYLDGNFSTIPRDAIFYVKDGRIQYPVKDIRITENIINLMKSISVIGKDSVQVTGWGTQPPNFENNVVTPSILCKKLNITKSKN
jgi:PmbA protein